jgi:hypothetical protein
MGFYRYISYQPEIDQVVLERKIYSTNPQTQYATWYTPKRYDDAKTAQKELALRKSPTPRVGPLPASEMPDFKIGLRPVAAANGQPGGGVEACVRRPVWLFGFLEFGSNPAPGNWKI